MTEAAVSFQQTVEQWLNLHRAQSQALPLHHRVPLYRQLKLVLKIDQDTRAIVQKRTIDDT
jgi:hypothetical protein